MEKQGSNKKQILLFYCVESEDLALKIAAESDSIQLQSINWRSLSFSIPLPPVFSFCFCISIALIAFPFHFLLLHGSRSFLLLQCCFFLMGSHYFLFQIFSPFRLGFLLVFVMKLLCVHINDIYALGAKFLSELEVGFFFQLFLLGFLLGYLWKHPDCNWFEFVGRRDVTIIALFCF